MINLEQEEASLVRVFQSNAFKLHITKAIDYVFNFILILQETLRKLERFNSISIPDILQDEPYLQGIKLLY
jgi:hypothetical protein